jgi:hypothetical protein
MLSIYEFCGKQTSTGYHCNTLHISGPTIILLTMLCSWTVGFDLVISLQTAMMKFSLEINGEVLGSVDAKYD